MNQVTPALRGGSGLCVTACVPAGGWERLRPEETVNPVLHRACHHLATLQVDAEAPVPPPEEDPWVTSVLEPRWELMPAAQEAVQGAAGHFAMTVPVRLALYVAATGSLSGLGQCWLRRLRFVLLCFAAPSVSVHAISRSWSRVACTTSVSGL